MANKLSVAFIGTGIMGAPIAGHILDAGYPVTVNNRRVEETIKGTKSNPRWFVPLFCALMIIGLIWAVVYYLTSDYPIPNIGAWNLAIAFAIIMIGFIMTMWWR